MKVQFNLSLDPNQALIYSKNYSWKLFDRTLWECFQTNNESREQTVEIKLRVRQNLLPRKATSFEAGQK